MWMASFRGFVEEPPSPLPWITTDTGHDARKASASRPTTGARRRANTFRLTFRSHEGSTGKVHAAWTCGRGLDRRARSCAVTLDQAGHRTDRHCHRGRRARFTSPLGRRRATPPCHHRHRREPHVLEPRCNRRVPDHCGRLGPHCGSRPGDRSAPVRHRRVDCGRPGPGTGLVTRRRGHARPPLG